MLTIVLLILLFLLKVIYLIVYTKQHLSYWTRMGIANVPPIIPYGNLKGIGEEYHIFQLVQKCYNAFKRNTPFFGMYFFFSRIAVVTDLSLLKKVLIQDSHIFNLRNFYYNEKDDPLSAHLFAIDGLKWRNLRTKLTSTFTSSKMKYMFPTVLEVGTRLVEKLEETISHTDEIEMKNFWARYTTDVIGTCAFGIECNTLNEKNGMFREMGRIIFEEPRRSMPVQLLINSQRKLSNFLKIKHYPDASTDFFFNVVKSTVELRRVTEVQRKDFMNILLNLNEPDALTLNEMAAQAFIFYIAGFETSSTLLTFCSYELAINQDIQHKSRQEAIDVLRRHNGIFTYEAMLEMKYINQVLYESLRKYPPLTSITRAPTQDYTVAGTGYSILKGTSVFIPVYAIHHDPDIYPDPELFDPNRFTPDEIAKRDPSTFLSFGVGSRNCIGLRFGLMQSRIGLVNVLLNFKWTLGAHMKVPIEFAKKQFILGSDEGTHLKMEKIINEFEQNF